MSTLPGGARAPDAGAGSPRQARAVTGDQAWLGLLVVGAAVVSTERWGPAGAVLAAAAAAAVALARVRTQDTAVVLAALCTAGAGSIHFAVVGQHFGEWWGEGVFFLFAGWAQLGWAAAVVRLRDRRLLWLGLAGSLVVVALWALTRTASLPLGAGRGSAEAVGAPDLVATTLETVAAAACAAALLGHRERAATATRWALALVVGATTAYALAAAAGAH